MTRTGQGCMIECTRAVWGPWIRPMDATLREHGVDLSLETRHEGGFTIIEVGGEVDV